MKPLASSLTLLTTVLLLIGMPSTTNKGLVLVKEDSPLMLIFEEEPTPEDPDIMVKPATFPAKLSKKLADFTLLNSAPSIC